MRRKLRHSIFTLFLTFIIVVPTILQFNHIFYNHHSELTNKVGYTQNKNLGDCSIFHFLFFNRASIPSKDDVKFLLFQPFETLLKTTNLYFIKQLFSIVTRGPPPFFVSMI